MPVWTQRRRTALDLYVRPMRHAQAPSGAGFLKPGFNVENIFQEGRDWREVHRRVRRYGVRLAAILATVVAAVGALLFKACSLIPRPA